MWWAKYLFSGFAFLGVSEDAPFHHSKRVLEVLVPLVLTALTMWGYVCLRSYLVPGVLGTLDDKLFQLVVFMVPFHLAALAALATFQSSALDKPPAGARASISRWSNEDNQRFRHFLSMREYACRLFGYLCTLGIIYLVVSISTSLINFSAIPWATNEPVRLAMFAGIVGFFWHYIVMSLFAIYFLIAKTV